MDKNMSKPSVLEFGGLVLVGVVLFGEVFE